jgi:nucleoside phosphorylase
VVNHQEGKETPAGFEPKAGEEKLASTASRCEALQSNAVEVATAIVGQAPTPPGNDGKRDARPRNVHVGRLVSGESFIASTAKRKWLRETFHADAVDMVSAGVARVCEANGVPYVIIRVLSDNADESASVAFTRFVQSGKGNEPVTVPIAIRLVEQAAPPHP